MESLRLLHKIKIVFAISIVFAFGCTMEPSRSPVPRGAEMLFWEWQSWEMGGRSRSREVSEGF